MTLNSLWEWTMTLISRQLALPVVLLSGLAVWQLTSHAQSNDGKAPMPLAKAGTRFNFEVIESFDAKYLGDTPGHLGRGGGLENSRPSVALGDHVYRGEKKIGTITSIVWSRVQSSLTVEFDPEPLTRIAVGDSVWIDLNPVVPQKSNN
jgi:hypothetical protein